MVQPASQHDLPGHEMEACVIRSWVMTGEKNYKSLVGEGSTAG